MNLIWILEVGWNFIKNRKRGRAGFCLGLHLLKWCPKGRKGLLLWVEIGLGQAVAIGPEGEGRELKEDQD